MLKELTYLAYVWVGAISALVILDTRITQWSHYPAIAIAYLFPPNIQYGLHMSNYIQKLAYINKLVLPTSFIISGVIFLQILFGASLFSIVKITIFLWIKSYLFRDTFNGDYTLNLVFFYNGMTIIFMVQNFTTKPLMLFLFTCNIAAILISNLFWNKRRIIGFTDNK